jgi:hypothetical protein
MTVRPSPSTIAVTTAFSMLGIACGSSTFWPTYQSTSFIVLVAVTIVIGTGIAVLGAIFRWSSAIVAVLTALAYLVFGVPLAVPGEAIGGILPSWNGLIDLITGAALGWKQLVTIATPVGAYQALLVPVFLVVLVASVVATTIALRARRGEWALLLPIVLFCIGIAVGPQAVDAAVPPAVALVIVLVLWSAVLRIRRNVVAALREQSGALAQSGSDRRRNRLRSALSVGIVLIVAVAAGTAAAVLVPPHGERDVVRRALERPFDPRDYPSPLSGFRKYLEPDASDKAMLSVSGFGDLRRIRIATLDTYDGVVYTVGSGSGSSESGTFTRVPGRVESPTSDGKDISIDVTIDGYRGVWLPGVGALREITFTGRNAATLQNAVYNNAVTGTSAVLGGLAAGDRYRLEATVGASRTIKQLAQMSPGSATLPRLTVLPDGIDQAVRDAGDLKHASGAQLAAALTSLVRDGYISHGIGKSAVVSHSGHSAARISQLLADVPMVGDQEQYAVAAALMARRTGFPARVVVGFVVPARDWRHESVTLTGSDISAWIEVQTKEAGWVSVDPNPAVRPIPQKQPHDPKKISRPQTAVQPPANDTKQDAAPPQQSRAIHTPKNTQNPLLELILAIATWAGIGLAALAVLLAPFAAVIAAKWRRRRKRRSATDPLDSISGGWREFSDAVLDHGFQPPPSATRSELAQTVGGMRPLVLATVADRAVFAPTPPSLDDADRVWRVVDELRESLAAGKTRWQRMRAAVSLASLGGYRRRKMGRDR